MFEDIGAALRSDFDRLGFTARYKQAILAVATCAKIIALHDLRGLLEAIDRAETLGPLLDPTLYRDKADDMRADAELLRAALPLWRMAKAHQAQQKDEDRCPSKPEAQ